jgi:hypothetical protein
MRNLFSTLFSLLLIVSTASAQDFEAAAKRFAAAQAAYSARHFTRSAREFQAAYEITKDPVLLYNIGESWERAGDGNRAVAAYGAYLAAVPDAQDKADVQQRIRAIEERQFKLVDQSAPGATPPGPATTGTVPAPESAAHPGDSDGGIAPTNSAAMPPPIPVEPSTTAPPPPVPIAPAPLPPAPQVGVLDEHRPTSSVHVAAWVGVATTVAVLTAGAIFGLAAQSRADEISRRLQFVDSSGQPRTFDSAASAEYANLRNEGRLYNGLAIGFFSAAGALAVTTTALFIADAKRPPKRVALRIAPAFGVGQGGLIFGGSF